MLLSVISVVFLCVIGIVIAQKVATSKIENFLSDGLPEHIEIEYETLDVSILSGSVSMGNPKLTVFGSTRDSIVLTNAMEAILIEDVDYWDYLTEDKIAIETIQITSPYVTYINKKRSEDDKVKSSDKVQKSPKIYVEQFIITNGEFVIKDGKTDSLTLKASNASLKIFDVEYNDDISKKAIPLEFSNYEFGFDSVFYKMNEFDDLQIGKSDLSKSLLRFNQLRLYTTYSKAQLSRMISIERDHVDFRVDRIDILDHEFGFNQDTTFYFKSPKLILENPILDIYRDKLIADDTEIKYLYSKLLRDLKIDLTLSKVELKNGTINYSEKVKEDHSAGELRFSKMDISIDNLSNTYPPSEKTNVELDAIFMKSTPLHVNWYFDVNSTSDNFIFKADIGRLPAPDLNPFSKPNLNVVFEGDLLKTYMTIDGNAVTSTVDFKTKYDDFKVSVLGKDGQEKNRFLSVVANLFIKKDSNEASQGFREGAKKTIERDNTKSIFNFVWLNARAGLLSALTGDGEK